MLVYIPGKCPLLSKHLYATFQEVNIAISIYTYEICILGKYPCMLKSPVIILGAYRGHYSIIVMHACNETLLSLP